MILKLILERSGGHVGLLVSRRSSSVVLHFEGEAGGSPLPTHKVIMETSQSEAPEHPLTTSHQRMPCYADGPTGQSS